MRRDPLIGTTLGKVEIRSRLGQGGMGVVYRGHQPNLGRDVAVKVLPADFSDDDDFVARFQQEARLVASLDHDNIVTIFDVDRSADGHFYIVMELVDGETLRQKRTGRPLTAEDVRVIGVCVARALAYAHERGIVHRDIKSANVMITRDGRVKLMDFGIAKAAGSGIRTLTGSVLGTPEYMAPEQVRGETVTPQTDVYSLGVLLYELATGTLPFRAETPIAIAMKHLTDEVTPPRVLSPSTPEWLERVILRCMEKAPADRWPDAAALADELTRAGADSDAIPSLVPTVSMGQGAGAAPLEIGATPPSMPAGAPVTPPSVPPGATVPGAAPPGGTPPGGTSPTGWQTGQTPSGGGGTGAAPGTGRSIPLSLAALGGAIVVLLLVLILVLLLRPSSPPPPDALVAQQAPAGELEPDRGTTAGTAPDGGAGDDASYPRSLDPGSVDALPRPPGQGTSPGETAGAATAAGGTGDAARTASPPDRSRPSVSPSPPAPSPPPSPPAVSAAPPPPSTDALWAQARRHERAGEVHSQAAALDRILAQSPNDARAREARDDLRGELEDRADDLRDELEDYLDDLADSLEDRDMDDVVDLWSEERLDAASRERMWREVSDWKSLDVEITLISAEPWDHHVRFTARYVVRGKMQRFGGDYQPVADRRWRGRFVDNGDTGFVGTGP